MVKLVPTIGFGIFPDGKSDVTPAGSATYHELRGIYSLKFPLSRNSLLPVSAPCVVRVRLPGGRLPLTIAQMVRRTLLFPLDAPTFRWMVSERVGSQLQYQCQYFLPASLVYIIGRLLTDFFVIEMLADRRQLIPDDRFTAQGRRAEAADWRPFKAADQSAFSRLITKCRQRRAARRAASGR